MRVGFYNQCLLGLVGREQLYFRQNLGVTQRLTGGKTGHRGAYPKAGKERYGDAG